MWQALVLARPVMEHTHKPVVGTSLEVNVYDKNFTSIEMETGNIGMGSCKDYKCAK